MFTFWLVYFILGIGLIITNVVISIITQGNSILIVTIIKLIPPKENIQTGILGFSTILLIIPIGLNVIVCLLPFLVGRCLSKSCSVEFSGKIVSFVKALGIVFVIITCLTTISDCLYFYKSNFTVYIYVVFIHALTLFCLIFLLHLTLNASKRLSVSVLKFHDFLIDYR